MSGPSRPSTVSPPQYHEGLKDRIESNILPTLGPYFALPSNKRVLEIASGQGVHCKVLSQHFPSLTFQPTECDSYMTSQCDKTNEGNQNVKKAIVLDVTDESGGWVELEKQAEEEGGFDLVLISNAMHMIPYPEGPNAMFKRFNSIVAEDGYFLAYGPFKTDRGFRSISDEKFDGMIRARENGTGLGLRSIDDLARLALEHGWSCVNAHNVPMGNLVLAYHRLTEEMAQQLQEEKENEGSADSSTLNESPVTETETETRSSA